MSGFKSLIIDEDIRFFINSFNSRHQTALYCAAKQGHLEIVKSIIKLSNTGSFNLMIDLQMRGHLNTALHAACEGEHVDVAALLIVSGASTTLVNSAGHMPAQVTKNQAIVSLFDPEEGNKEALQVLRKFLKSKESQQFGIFFLSMFLIIFFSHLFFLPLCSITNI